jgi:hypothetical protein
MLLVVLHVTDPQLVVDVASWQTPPAAQLPVNPHGGAAVHWPDGAAVPPVTLAHVPLVPPVSVAEHAMQVPVHAVLQQNPLAQRLFVHASSVVHGTPCAPLATQVPDPPGFMQYSLDDAQSESVPHAALQAVELEQMTPSGQAAIVPPAHVPDPLHILAEVSVLPVHDAAAPQDTLDAASSQTPPAAQLPVSPHGGAAVH